MTGTFMMSVTMTAAHLLHLGERFLPRDLEIQTFFPVSCRCGRVIANQLDGKRRFEAFGARPAALHHLHETQIWIVHPTNLVEILKHYLYLGIGQVHL